MDVAARLMAAEPRTGPSARPGLIHYLGWAVTALRFASGHELALRVFLSSHASSLRAVWHREPSRRWMLYLDETARERTQLERQGGILHTVRRSRIMLAWPRQDVLHVRVDWPALDWTLHLARVRWRQVLNRLAIRLPEHVLGPDSALAQVRRVVTAALDPGVPVPGGGDDSGRALTVRPRDVWTVTDSIAVLDGIELGGARPADGKPGRDYAGWLVLGDAFVPAGTTKV